MCRFRFSEVPKPIVIKEEELSWKQITGGRGGGGEEFRREWGSEGEQDLELRAVNSPADGDGDKVPEESRVGDQQAVRVQILEGEVGCDGQRRPQQEEPPNREEEEAKTEKAEEE